MNSEPGGQYVAGRTTKDDPATKELDVTERIGWAKERLEADLLKKVSVAVLETFGVFSLGYAGSSSTKKEENGMGESLLWQA